jgi:predicted nuclease of restriction endonuclease-like (RecB) superfamily
MNFEQLVKAIREADQQLAASASKAVNISLTTRNWLIGYYIAEYELHGADRAEYGEYVLAELSQQLTDVSNCQQPQLYRYIRFYRVYPQILCTASIQSIASISRLKLPDERSEILCTASIKSDSDTLIDGTTYAQFATGLVGKLSYSHFDKLIEIDDDTKRLFYEVECVRGGWSVRELRRQIGSLYYERSGLSLNKKKLSELAQRNAEQMSGKIAVRDPYVFEFLGLKPAEVMSENQLEDYLMNKLGEFIIELGHGFCFEARQKRILIGDEHYYIDMVFYHRILRCHVLIELKTEEFSQENIGQLNTYVSWYRKNMMAEYDNPPIGILLCTGKKEALVEYALAGMDNNLFVSKYLLELPKKEDMQAFIEQQMKELDSKNNGG